MCVFVIYIYISYITLFNNDRKRKRERERELERQLAEPVASDNDDKLDHVEARWIGMALNCNLTIQNWGTRWHGEKRSCTGRKCFRSGQKCSKKTPSPKLLGHKGPSTSAHFSIELWLNVCFRKTVGGGLRPWPLAPW